MALHGNDQMGQQGLMASCGMCAQHLNICWRASRMPRNDRSQGQMPYDGGHQSRPVGISSTSVTGCGLVGASALICADAADPFTPLQPAFGYVFLRELDTGADSTSFSSFLFKLEHRQQLTIVPHVTRPFGPSHTHRGVSLPLDGAAQQSNYSTI